MKNVLTETFLYEFFIYNGVLGKFCEKKAVFDTLGEMFCLPQEKLDQLYGLATGQAVSEVDSDESYKRYRRIKQYNALTGTPEEITPEEDEVLAVKGEVITKLKEYAMLSETDSTEFSVVNTLMSEAEKGNIVALRVLGVLQCEGLVVTKNVKAGCKNLMRATQWGSIPATIAFLKYSDFDKVEVVKALNASVRKTPYEFLAETVKEKYGIREDGLSEGVVLLKKAFSVDRLKEDQYIPMYKRLAFCSALGFSDKEKLILSEDKMLHGEAFDLPLQLSYRELVADRSVWEGKALYRSTEVGCAQNALSAIDLRAYDLYRPMCFVTDSDFVAEYYVGILGKSLKTARIKRIDVSDLTEYDLESSKNNVFLRDLDEKGNNVAVLIFRGRVSERHLDYAKNFLRAEKRRTFHINRPAISLDLSSILPICVCDKENVKYLEGLVEYIDLAPVSNKEKPDVIREVFAEKGAFYGIKSVKITDGAVAELSKLSVEKAVSVIDKVLRENRFGDEIFSLTEQLAVSFVQKEKGVKNPFGFGGTI